MNESYWILSSKGKVYESLQKNIDTTCAIVGGGIVGVTTAYLLAKNGIEVVIVDADKIGYGSSGRNTGKVTSQHNVIYSKIIKKYGDEAAKLYYEINNKALNLIEDIIKENKIECNFERLSSYIFTENENYLELLIEEYKSCKKLGIDCDYYDELNIPFNVYGAIGFNNQAQINPKKYIDGLIQVCENLGVKIYENTAIIDIDKGKKVRLKTEYTNVIEADNVVIASHFPWYDGMNFYFAKEKGDRSYLIASEYNRKFQRGMFISIEEPGKTFRHYKGEGKDLLICGGGDHKVGQGGKEEDIYHTIEEMAKEKFESKEALYKWSAQDYMSYDHMPYIGHINKKEDNIFVATGFSKWGMTNGCASGIILSELILNNISKYENIFKPSRLGPYFTTDFIKENFDVGSRYLAGKINLGNDYMPNRKGEGRIINIDGKRYGAYRHYNGELYIVDITCTHLGCELKFNGAEKTWDCPCHASRFDYEGNILEGPAIRPLNKFNEGKNKIYPILR
ncbi:MAG: FAD-dependent oxidoreductase [Peptostreptococcaceae bacterium]